MKTIKVIKQDNNNNCCAIEQNLSSDLFTSPPPTLRDILFANCQNH